MKGDFSRRTHDPRKHYSAVLQQQGRLLTDADLEEEHRIVSGQLETATADVIGGCGGPLDGAGFQVTSNGTNLFLSAGRYYAGGMLTVNEAAVEYRQQPDRFLAAGDWPPAPGRYAIALDVWRRLITEIDDPSIREVALGGPTTSVREKTVWQVRHLAVPANWTCAQGLPGPQTTTGTMAAQAEPEAALSTPCLVPPLAGYTGLENQLYRVEVFGGGASTNLSNVQTLPVVSIPAGTTNQLTLANNVNAPAAGSAVEIVRVGQGTDPLDATFAHVAAVAGKTLTLTAPVPPVAASQSLAVRVLGAAFVVSRENGSVVTAIERIDGREVTVASLGPDEVLGFRPGDWVELSDDRVELESLTRQLRQVEAIDTDRRVITLRTAAANLAANADGVVAGRHSKLRRWDAARGIVFRADGTGWIHLEDGIQVRFTAGQYVSGDYWQFPARAAIVDAASGNIEWPQQGNAPALLSPAGIEHHFCPLAAVQVAQGADGSTTVSVVADCRDLFPPVTDLTNLLYVGGDGQEARPQGGGGVQALPAPIAVRVANGGRPVAGAQVEFRITDGAGQLNGGGGTVVVTTGVNGGASATWAINVQQSEHTCEARLLDSGGSAIAHQRVAFHATVDRDAEGEGGRCCCVSVGEGAEFTRIDEAIAVLLERGERDICLCLMPGNHDLERLELKQPDFERPVHLSISGCGRGTRVHVKAGIVVDRWASLRLAAFDLRMERETFLLALGVDEVTLEDIQASGAPPKVGLVRIHAASRVRVANCVIEARQQEQQDRLRRLVAGLGPLERAFEAVDDRERGVIARRAATELSGLTAAARRTFARSIVTRLNEQGREFPAAVSAVMNRLAASVTGGRDPNATVAAINDLRAAIVRQSDMVALEIGVPDELQEKISDPSTVTTATVQIESNDIVGNISLYGQAGGRALNVDERQLLEGRVKGGQALLPGLAGTVHIVGNRFARLLLSSGMNEALRQLAMGQFETLPTLYASLHLTNNVIDGANGQMAALHSVLTSNDYTLDAVTQPSGQVLLATLIGDTAIYTGNHGAFTQSANGAAVPTVIDQSVRTFGQAANLELNLI